MCHPPCDGILTHAIVLPGLSTSTKSSPHKVTLDTLAPADPTQPSSGESQPWLLDKHMRNQVQMATSAASTACNDSMELSSSAVSLAWHWSIGTYAEIVMPHSEYPPHPVIPPAVGCLSDELSRRRESNQGAGGGGRLMERARVVFMYCGGGCRDMVGWGAADHHSLSHPRGHGDFIVPSW